MGEPCWRYAYTIIYRFKRHAPSRPCRLGSF